MPDNDKISISKFNDKTIKIRYINENEFNKLTRALKKYNMYAYKDFIFNLVKQIKSGILVGEKLEDNTYKCRLLSNDIFDFVYGKLYFTYKVEDNIATLIDMEPKEFLMAGFSKELSNYKGVPITGPRDRFKVDLYFSMKNKK